MIGWKSCHSGQRYIRVFGSSLRLLLLWVEMRTWSTGATFGVVYGSFLTPPCMYVCSYVEGHRHQSPLVVVCLEFLSFGNCIDYLSKNFSFLGTVCHHY